MTRTRYIAFRSVQTVFLLWLILTFLFFFFRLMPGSYLDMIVQQGASQEAIAAIKERWGLDQPLYIQYWQYLVNLFTLDAGTSFSVNKPVWDYVKFRIFNSFILVAPPITLTYILGSAAGVIMGTNRGSRFERYGIVGVIFAGAFPSFFIGIVLIVIFAGWLGWFPTSGMVSASSITALEAEQWWRQYTTRTFAEHYVLPFTAIFLRYSYLPTLIMRTNVVEVMGQDFIQYHRLTGTPWRRQLQKIARHASLPVITLYPVSMTRAVGGLVLIETVFNWPGIGYALVQAVLIRDIPVVQFVFFLVAIWVVVGNFVVDIVYQLVDPRVTIE